MPTVLNVREMAAWLQGLQQPMLKAAGTALLEAAVLAEGLAKKNAQAQLRGTSDRPPTGTLLSRITAGFGRGAGGSMSIGQTTFTAHATIDAFVGVMEPETAPYGRAQEYGAEIEPKKARHLWVPLFGPKSGGAYSAYNRMTPSQFVQMMSGGKGQFFIVPGKKGGFVAMVDTGTATGPRGGRVRLASNCIPLFALRDKVTLPARPYIQPAVAQAAEKLPELLDKHVSAMLGKA